MIIANHMVEHTDLDQVWLIVSPHNPLKEKKSLANDYDRLHLVNLAIGNMTKLRASNIEFSLPKPSYTIDTLTYLHEKHPSHTFILIMGGDNVPTLPKWKNYEQLIANYTFYIYQRPSYNLGPLAEHINIQVTDAPLLDISASYIRKCIQRGKSVRYLVPDAVHEYIEGSSLYKKK
jgi:nicotinate-nucleotide adenylyltransferase